MRSTFKVNTLYLNRNNKARPCDHCCGGKEQKNGGVCEPRVITKRDVFSSHTVSLTVDAVS